MSRGEILILENEQTRKRKPFFDRPLIAAKQATIEAPKRESPKGRTRLMSQGRISQMLPPQALTPKSGDFQRGGATRIRIVGPHNKISSAVQLQDSFVSFPSHYGPCPDLVRFKESKEGREEVR